MTDATALPPTSPPRQARKAKDPIGAAKAHIDKLRQECGERAAKLKEAQDRLQKAEADLRGAIGS